MNHVQIRQIHQAARDELVRTATEEKQKIQRELKRLQTELNYASEHCPNRCASIRAEMEALNQKLAVDEVAAFDHVSSPYLDRIDQLRQDELETWFRKIRVVYNFQSPHNSMQISSSNATSPNHSNNNDLYVCAKCDEVRVCDEFEAFSVCMRCGHALPFHKDAGESGETLQYTMQFEYDRVNHFRECLNQIIKAVENVPSIDRRVFRYIKQQIIKERITNRAMITRRRIKDWLKRDKSMNKYSERVFSILYAVCKIRPPKISKALEQKFYEMFHDIQKPFSKHVPAGRTHFFNYSFILRKFCELLGQDQLVPVFDILKGVDRVHFQDEIWKRCCAEKGWKFIPSI